MTDTPLTPAEDDEALAAEFVLGLLPLPDRMATEARIRRDPEFAARITAWESRLEGMNDDFAEVPAPNLMPQIEARLFPAAPRKRRNWWPAWLTGAATAVALVVFVLAVLPPPPPPLGARLVADDVTFEYDARFAGENLTVTRVSGAPIPADKVLELWIIAPDQPPVSLGLLTADSQTISYPQPKAPGWLLAISLEPTGGSPTGAPTGPVLAAAPLMDL